jgi:hypothetical protein
MTQELIIKFFQNKCTSDEIDEIIKWFRYDADKNSAHLMLKQIWNNYSTEKDTFKNIQFENILDKLHHNINIKNSEKLQGEKDIIHLPVKRRYNFRTVLTRVAVILFIPLLSVLIYTLVFSKFNNNNSNNIIVDNNTTSYIEIEAPVGSRTNVELADGTKVWLNHGSKLKYSAQFTGENRVVQLVGEAYFEVAHNPQKPFIVKTDKIQVTALGTEFNVMAYPGEQIVNTTLVSGKVLVEKRLNENETIKICEMQPNQLVKFNLKKNTYSCVATATNKYTSWKDGILIFDNNPIDEVALRLSKWYNVEFVIENPKVRELVYNATFVDETLFQVLELMKIATPITYKITNRKKMADGTFSKRKVYINLKNSYK